jgi:dihydroorotate dehydrogenase (NAD+) catalytic subunit
MPGVPIVGVGGILTGADALEFIAAGASAVQVGTAIFHDPSAPVRIIRELRAELAVRGIAKLSEAIGLAHNPPSAAGASHLDPDDHRTPPRES